MLGTNTSLNHDEIDVIEGINLWTSDQTSVHTSSQCDFTNMNITNMTGKWTNKNCTIPSNGCAIIPNENNTYGKGFNEMGGGIYVTELTDDIGIKIWFWSMNDKNIPKSIYNKQPNTNEFGIPYAYFPFGNNCPSRNWYNIQIMFDIYLCGWAGDKYFWDTNCQNYTKNQTCQQWVANNPSYFKDAYWLINFVDVYTK